MSSDTSEQQVYLPKRGRPKKQLITGERVRRDIANENERRRMEYINSGFQSLRQILKRRYNTNCKQTKAAILRESANYIQWLEREISLIANQNQLLKNCLNTKQNFKPTERSFTNTDSSVTIDGNQEFRSSLNKDAMTNEWLEKCGQQNITEKRTHLQKEMNSLKTSLKKEWILRQKLEESRRSVEERAETTEYMDLDNGLQRECSPSYMRPKSSPAATQSSPRSTITAEESPIDLRKKYYTNSLSSDTQKNFYDIHTNEFNTAKGSSISTNKRSPPTHTMTRQQYNYNEYKPQNEYNLSENMRAKMFETNRNAIVLPVNMPFPMNSECVSTTTAEGYDTCSGQPLSTSGGFKKNLEMMLKAIRHIEGNEFSTDIEMTANSECMKQMPHNSDYRHYSDLQNYCLRKVLSGDRRETETNNMEK